MKEEKLVVGVIGLHFGKTHLNAALANGAEVAAICDLDEERLNAAAEEFNIPKEKRFTDYRELLKMEEINVVTLGIPDQQHKKLVLEFLNAGKNVMCEKPLALTRADLEEIIKATEKSDKKLMVGQICHFTPSFMKAKEIIDSGEIGEVYYVESEYAHDYVKLESVWRNDPIRHGVIGGGCHAVDLLRWFVGDPIEVFAYGAHKAMLHLPYDDATISVLKFNNGVIGKVFVSTGCKRNYTMRTLVYGTLGTIICDNTSTTLQVFKTDSVNELVGDPEIVEVDPKNHNAEDEFKEFADALLNDKPVIMSALEGAKTIEACLSIVESAKTGKIVKPNYNF